jgi:dihydrofolate synthase / folylpolyglutamate synthase
VILNNKLASHGGTEERTGLQYLYSLAQWQGKGDFGLDDILKVLAELGDPQDSIPSIHIAGTNGKGSVSAALASILGSAGYRVGLTISPHLEHPRERIIIDGLPISDDFLEEQALILKETSERIGVNLSFHEGMTALAFMAFASQRLDYIVLEVGLGGTRDSTNVIKQSKVAAIVTIDYDHVEILGPSLADIARQKAGIIKGGETVVMGALPPEAEAAVQEVANKKHSKVHVLGTDFDVSVNDHSFRLSSGQSFTAVPALQGSHQYHNMAVASEIASLLNISVESIRQGIESVYWPGRLESVGKGLLLDCAHNPAGIRTLISFLDSQCLKDITLVFGVLNTKGWREMADLLSPRVKSWFIIEPPSKNAVGAHEIKEYLSSIGVKEVRTFSDYDELSEELNRVEGMRIVSGSMYMLAEVRRRLQIPSRPYWIRRVN